MPKTYYCTREYEYLCKGLQEEVVKKLMERWPGLNEDQIDYICPLVAAWEEDEVFAEPQDYDDKDIPNLEKMVELGLLESEEHEGE